MRVLKTIIIENDQHVVKLFQDFERENSVLFNIIQIVASAKDIVKIINEQRPDALIVGWDSVGFDRQVLNTLDVRKPKLLFLSKNKVDAYDAFKSNASDFLLKPIQFNALIVSIYKMIKVIEMETVFQNDVIGKIKTINEKHNYEYLSISSVDKIELIKIKDIVYCKADGKYTEFYINNNSKILSSKNLGEYVSVLKDNFFRIHHSYIINIDYIEKIVKQQGLFCQLNNGHLLPVAKRRQEEFVKFINI